MNFLNCNYPGPCKIPKGKPKCLTKARFEMKLDNITLIEQKKGTVWFKEDCWYWGIQMDIKYNGFGLIDKYATIAAIETELIKHNRDLLSRTQEDLLYRYLKVIE